MNSRTARSPRSPATAATTLSPNGRETGGACCLSPSATGNRPCGGSPADGSGKAELLYQPEDPFNEAVMSPDGKWLIYRTAPGPHNRDIYAVPLDGDRKPVLLVGGPAQESHPRVSPDGKWLAYQSNESGRFEIYVRPFPNPGARSGEQPGWRGADLVEVGKGNLLSHAERRCRVGRGDAPGRRSRWESAAPAAAGRLLERHHARELRCVAGRQRIPHGEARGRRHSTNPRAQLGSGAA